jgi:CheY-like chemotaxis protein
MPDMNGVEFLRALRQRPQHRDTPVVVATSERDDSSLHRWWRRRARVGTPIVVRARCYEDRVSGATGRHCSGLVTA